MNIGASRIPSSCEATGLLKVEILVALLNFFSTFSNTHPSFHISGPPSTDDIPGALLIVKTPHNLAKLALTRTKNIATRVNVKEPSHPYPHPSTTRREFILYFERNLRNAGIITVEAPQTMGP
jgi:hypothetical protein